MRSISCVADVSVNTISTLLVEADQACLTEHDEAVRNRNSDIAHVSPSPRANTSVPRVIRDRLK